MDNGAGTKVRMRVVQMLPIASLGLADSLILFLLSHAELARERRIAETRTVTGPSRAYYADPSRYSATAALRRCRQTRW